MTGPYGVADWRQPLTDFERAAGVFDPDPIRPMNDTVDDEPDPDDRFELRHPGHVSLVDQHLPGCPAATDDGGRCRCDDDDLTPDPADA